MSVENLIPTVQPGRNHAIEAVTVEGFSIDRGPRGAKCFFGMYEYHAGGGRLITIEFHGAVHHSVYEVLDWLREHCDEIRENVSIVGMVVDFHSTGFSSAEIADFVDRAIVSTRIAERRAMRQLAAINSENK